MTRSLLGTTAAALVLFTATSSGQVAPSETWYADAQAKEKAVRTALAGTLAPDALQKAVHTVVADYEALVREHPTSTYSDDALWNAATLLIEGFKKTADPGDRADALQLLTRLATEYPTSKLSAQVRATTQAAQRLKPVPPARPVSTVRTVLAQPTEPVAAVLVPASRPTPSTPAARGVATISDIKRSVLGDMIRVTIAMDHEVGFHDERLTAPDRVFVDLAPTRLAPALADRTLRFDGDTHPVRQIRTGRHENDTSRVVLETAGIASCDVYPMYAPYRLVFECLRVGAKPTPPPPPAVILPALPPITAPATALRRIDVSRTLPSLGKALPTVTSGLGATLAALRQSTPIVAGRNVAPGTPAVPSAPPARNLAGGFSLARQLGLSVSRIVIDPGHGGQDPGAKGGGLTEADLVLDIALRLEKLLLASGTNEVILTRRKDEFVPLEERTAIANREGADLFLSIHTNASNTTDASGVESYYLNFASNLSAAAVAARENAASGQSMSELPDVVKTIALNTKLDESRDFAAFVQREVVTKLRPSNKAIKDLGVKQAPFVVLIGAAMPSVLTEIAFLTNSQEARLLRGAAYRQRIAEGLFNAIHKYQTALKRETATE